MQISPATVLNSLAIASNRASARSVSLWSGAGGWRGRRPILASCCKTIPRERFSVGAIRPGPDRASWHGRKVNRSRIVGCFVEGDNDTVH